VACEKFSRSCAIAFETPKYIVKIAECWDEVAKALFLRSTVFNEHVSAVPVCTKHDIDFYADHVIIIDKNSECCAATYRLLHKGVSDVYYSEQEFDLTPLDRYGSDFLELSRACIHKDYRGRHLINLLWKAIGLYAAEIEVRYLFGCSSVFNLPKEYIMPFSRYVKKHYGAPSDFHIKVRESYMFNPAPEKLKQFPDGAVLQEDFTHFMPSLLSSYLNLGAWICGGPAIDEDFNCVDFLTLLDLQRVNSRVKKHFFSAQRS